MSVLTPKGVDDLAFLRGPCQETIADPTRPSIGIVDLFAGCGAMSVGAIEGARRAGVGADLRLAVDLWKPGLEVIDATFDSDRNRTLAFDLGKVLDEDQQTARRASEYVAGHAGTADLLLAGPPCQGHSALNNHTRHNDERNDLYLAVARISERLKPMAIIVENVRGVGRDRRRAVDRCVSALKNQGYVVQEGTLDVHELGAPQRRIRHVLVASIDSAFDFNALAERSGRTVAWAIGDLDGIDGQTLFDTASVPSPANEARLKWLVEEGEFDLPNHLRPECHHDDHSYRSMYGRLRWDQPSQTITSGFGSMGQGRFVHPGSPRTLTPHEAARLQFIPDFVDFSTVEQRGDLATMIGNAVPPILTMVLANALIDQGLL